MGLLHQAQFLLDSGAERIIEILEDAGYEAYAVGGCVRDVLLGRDPQDWDITTSASPEEISACFLRTFDTGIKHGTVSVRLYGHTYEVTTYRVDGDYADHRRPDSVTFTSSLREDLARRDFTINAMAFHPERGLVDLFEGQKDLARRVVRCVGVPADRFEEDALRMLRALRFAAYLSFDIDPATYAAVAEKAPLMRFISRERIAEEMNKILLSAHPDRMAAVWETGLMPYCLPQFDGTDFPFESLSEVPAVRVLRWAMLLRRLSEDESNLALRELKFDNDTRLRVARIARYREETLPTEPGPMRHFLHELGPRYFEELYAVRRALGTENEASYAQYLAQRDCPLEIRDLAVGGRDLMEQGISGPAVGAVLSALLERVLDEPGLNRRESLLELSAEI